MNQAYKPKRVRSSANIPNQARTVASAIYGPRLSKDHIEAIALRFNRFAPYIFWFGICIIGWTLVYAGILTFDTWR